jgi:hypothetical protein
MKVIFIRFIGYKVHWGSLSITNRIVTSSVEPHVTGINRDCFSYDMKNVGEAK